MRSKLATVALALVIVLAALGWQARVEGPRWQYMVVAFHGDVEKQTKQFNDLADQGWEYVGLIATPGGGAAGGSVAFRRPKK
jgi:hypothetical protein